VRNDFHLHAQGMSARLADELIPFGAVYVACPLAPGQKGVKTGRQSWERHAQGPAPPLSKAIRMQEDMDVPPHSYVRVHENPKRHPQAALVEWRERIVYEDAQMVVVDKV
jgi:hypothetical protein